MNCYTEGCSVTQKGEMSCKRGELSQNGRPAPWLAWKRVALSAGTSTDALQAASSARAAWARGGRPRTAQTPPFLHLCAQSNPYIKMH